MEMLPGSTELPVHAWRSISFEVIQSLESDLIAWDDPSVRPLVDYQQTMQRISRLERSKDYDKEWQLLQEHQRNVRLERRLLLDRLTKAYITALTLSNSLLQAVLKCARLLDERHRTPLLTIQEQEATNALEQIIESLNEFDTFFQERYKSLYQTASRTTSDESLRALGELTQMSTFWRHIHNTAQDDCETLERMASTLCKSHPCIILEADLGMGKTTFMKQLARDLARSAQGGNEHPLPVLTLLASLANSSASPLEERINNSAQQAFAGLVEIQRPHWHLLDGFDEIDSVELRNHVLHWATQNRPTGSRAVLSSRPSALPPYVVGAVRARLLPLTRAQVSDFVKRFPWRDASVPERLLDILNANENLQSMCRSPLLLTLIAILAFHRSPERLPARRDAIYQEAVDLLLGGWDSAKNVSRPLVVADEETRFALVRRVAFRLYEEGRRAFTREEFSETLLACSPDGLLDASRALDFFSELLRDCVLIPFSEGSYSFFHLSVQEYMVALELASDIHPERVFRAIHDHFRNPAWWGEVLTFYAGIKRDVSHLINELHRHLTAAESQKGTQSSTLRRLLTAWLSVADLTRLESLNPRGSVAAILAQLASSQEARFLKLASIDGISAHRF
jgi:predicted NACHT family NTPase